MIDLTNYSKIGITKSKDKEDIKEQTQTLVMVFNIHHIIQIKDALVEMLKEAQ